jgi:hypothetical protein
MGYLATSGSCDKRRTTMLNEEITAEVRFEGVFFEYSPKLQPDDLLDGEYDLSIRMYNSVWKQEAPKPKNDRIEMVLVSDCPMSVLAELVAKEIETTIKLPAGEIIAKSNILTVTVLDFDPRDYAGTHKYGIEIYITSWRIKV